MSDEIKSCPFCGSRDVHVSEDDHGIARWVMCDNEACECSGPCPYPPHTGTRDEIERKVVADWNRRA